MYTTTMFSKYLLSRRVLFPRYIIQNSNYNIKIDSSYHQPQVLVKEGEGVEVLVLWAELSKVAPRQWRGEDWDGVTARQCDY